MSIACKVRPIGGEALLPDGYRRCEYLESTGTQWIVTETFSNVDYIEADFIFQYTRMTGERQLFGLASASPNFGINASGNWESFLTPADLNIHRLKMGMGRLSGELFFIFENARKDRVVGDWWKPDTVRWICNPFALDRNGYLPSCIRSYGAKVTGDNNLLCNLIPCLDDKGKPCMFDTVSRTAFYNQGTGEFLYKLKTPLIRKLPRGYYSLDYLESTGTQWIDTGVRLSNESEVRCVLETQDLDGLQRQTPYGFAGSPSTQFYCFSQFVETPNSGSKSVFYLPNNYIFTENRIVGTCSITHNKHGITINGITTPARNEVTEYFETDSGCHLFIAANTSAFFIGRIYTFNISRSNSLQLAYIPCLDPEGVPCMYDLVSHQPFRNNGTGQFIAGMTLEQVRSLSLPAGGGQLTLSLPYEASIDKLAQDALEQARENGWELTLQYAESDVPAGYRKLDFLESTGTQYIDTGIKADAGISAACVYYQSPEVLESATGPQYIFGCGADTGIFAFLGLHTAAPSTLFYYKSTLTLRAERPSGKIACLCDATGMELNGTRYEFSSTAELTESFDNCKLFARGDGKFATWANAKAQVYSFSISRAGEMQVDYVPCISPDGTLGMYNRVDGTLKENAGTGAFIAGLATVDDVRKLWLPETSGELTVSVPADTPDSAVEQLRKNNPTWQIAIQYRQ